MFLTVHGTSQTPDEWGPLGGAFQAPGAAAASGVAAYSTRPT